jgi:hypothetical protein
MHGSKNATWFCNWPQRSSSGAATCWAWLVAACLIGCLLPGELFADDTLDAVDAVPPQLRAAQENALNWWRESANHVTTVESTHTNRHGHRERTVVFILRDPNGRSLAVGRAGTIEMQTFFEQRLNQRLAQVAQEHGLDETQLAKLKLAADLDINRFNRRVQEAEKSLNTAAALEDTRSFKNYLSSIAQDCDGGLFDEQSLYARVLSTLLAFDSKTVQ